MILIHVCAKRSDMISLTFSHFIRVNTGNVTVKLVKI